MLMLGAFLGYIVAFIFNNLGFNVDPVLISMIGMGAFLSAVARTPITAVVMVFEMTSGYSHILPIMLSAAIADLIAEKLNHKPIYAELIVNQVKSKEAKLLSGFLVKDYMNTDVKSLYVNQTIEDAGYYIKMYGYSYYPVLNEKQKLVGVISKSDIEDALFQGINNKIELNKIMNPSPVTIGVWENLYIAYYRLHSNNIEILVVTDNSNELKGIIKRQDINLALNK